MSFEASIYTPSTTVFFFFFFRDQNQKLQLPAPRKDVIKGGN
jgi:hypothetical protein